VSITGSSLGVEFASSRDEVPQALVAAFSYDDRVLLERYVKGRELAVSVLGGEALPVVEAIPREEDFFNFEARYEIGRTEYVCPAELAEAEARRGQELATRTYETLGCSGFARVDLMLGDEGPRVLEVNAIPGLTDTSTVGGDRLTVTKVFTVMPQTVPAESRPVSTATPVANRDAA